MSPKVVLDAGALLGASEASDVVDAAVVCLASDGDVIVTSDPEDIGRLVAVAGSDVRLVVV